MPRWEHSIDINATPARVWAVLADVSAWPEWTASILTVEDVSPNFGAGGSAVVHALGTPKSKFTVTRWEPGRGFDWQTKTRGATAIGGHWIEGAGEGRSRATVSIEMPGLIARLAAPFVAKRIVRNLEMEAEGLKKQSESGA